MRDDRRDVVMATQVNKWKGKFCIDYFFRAALKEVNKR